MFSRFFIDRPIFAAVLSIVITLAGGDRGVQSSAWRNIPRSRRRRCMVTCNYPGASAEVVAETVAAPIEQQVNGVEDMMYMSSQCTNDGSYTLTVTFKHGVNLNLAQVLVQNRVNLALPLLPDVLKQTGVTTRKTLAGHPHGRSTSFARRPLRPALPEQLRPDAGQGRDCCAWTASATSSSFGQRDYSMRLWVDPDKLAVAEPDGRRRGRGPPRAERSRWPAGHIGQQPTVPGQQTRDHAHDPGPADRRRSSSTTSSSEPRRDGRIIRLKDVGRVELGAKNDDVSSPLDGKPTVGLAIFQLPDANALDTADRIRDKMEELKQGLPRGRRLRHSLRHHAVHRANRIHEVVQDAARRRSSWWPWWCWCSCRTGGRRSFR